MKHRIVMYMALPTMILLTHADAGWAARGPVRSMKAVRTDTPPAIDGKIDESCWSKADTATGFTDYKLERLALEQTIVRVLYDDENLYVAFECIEPDPNNIVAIERKYDLSLSDEDSATVRFDTFHDHRCNYIFSVNTLGTRWRASFLDISRGFKPDLGYIPRRNIRGPGSYLSYWQYYDKGEFKSLNAISEIQVYENDDHDTVLRYFMEGAGVGFHNDIELWYIRSDKFHAPFRDYSDRITVEYNEEADIWDSVSGSVAKDVYEEEPHHEYSLEEPAKITDRLVTTLEGNYRVKEPQTGGQEDIWLWRWITQYNFVWNARIKFTAEQTWQDRHNLTMLFSWPMKQNTDLYVLLNDYEIYGEIVRAAFVKMIYRFNPLENTK